MVAYKITSLINVAQKFIDCTKCDYDGNGYINGRKEEFMVMNAMGVESMNELLRSNTRIELDESGKTYKSLKYFFSEEKKDSSNEILGNIAANLNEMYLIAQERFDSLVYDNKDTNQLMTRIKEEGDLDSLYKLKKNITKSYQILSTLKQNILIRMEGPNNNSNLCLYALDEEIEELNVLNEELNNFINQVEELSDEQQKYAIMYLGKNEIFENLNLITKEVPKLVIQYGEYGESDVELIKSFIDKTPNDEDIESLYENVCPLTRRLLKSWAEYVYDQDKMTGINELNSQNHTKKTSGQLSFKTTEKQNNQTNIVIYTAAPAGQGLYRIFKIQADGIKKPIEGVYTREQLQQQYPKFFD